MAPMPNIHILISPLLLNVLFLEELTSSDKKVWKFRSCFNTFARLLVSGLNFSCFILYTSLTFEMGGSITIKSYRFPCCQMKSRIFLALERTKLIRGFWLLRIKAIVNRTIKRIAQQAMKMLSNLSCFWLSVFLPAAIMSFQKKYRRFFSCFATFTWLFWSVLNFSSFIFLTSLKIKVGWKLLEIKLLLFKSTCLLYHLYYTLTR